MLSLLETTFKKLIKAELDREIDTPEEENIFRCSSLPFCKVDLALKTLIEDYKDTHEHFRGDFYTSVGTTMHSVVQRWLSLNGKLFGDWVCPTHLKAEETINFLRYNKIAGKETIKRLKKLKKKHPIVKRMKGPQYCKKCGEEMIYEEVVLNTPEGLSGHTDGLIPYKDGYIIFELKSITKRGLEEDALPYRHNMVQANSYGVIAEKHLGFKIYGAVILYLSRDTHTNYKFFVIDKLNYKLYEKHLKDIKKVKKAIKKKDFSKIKVKCKSPEDEKTKYCQWKSLCFKGDIQDHFKKYLEL